MGGNMGGGFGVLMTIFSIGYWIYSLFNPKKSDRPDPEQIQSNNYQRNMPVPIVYGTDKVTGTCIYLGNTSAEYVEAGGKGGFGLILSLFILPGPQEMPGWKYTADFAVGLSEGETHGIIGIYLNNVNLNEVLDRFNYEYYDGTSSQGIDASILAILGDIAIPWRHTAYLFLSGDLQNVSTIPTIEAEIAGLLCYESEPLTTRWKNLEQIMVTGAQYISGSEDWSSYHVTGYYSPNYAYNWIFPDFQNQVLYLISHSSSYDGAEVYKIITNSTDWEDLATSIYRVSNVNTFAHGDHEDTPHNLKVNMELVKGEWPSPTITRYDNVFLFVDMSSKVAGSYNQFKFQTFKIDSFDSVNNAIYLSYDYGLVDGGMITKGDLCYLFTYSDNYEYVGTWNNTYDSEGHLIATGLRNAVNGIGLLWYFPSIDCNTSAIYTGATPCCDPFASEMWSTHHVVRSCTNATDPYRWNIWSYDTWVSDIAYSFPDYHFPWTCVGGGGRKSKRPIYVLTFNNYSQRVGTMSWSWWKVIGTTATRLNTWNLYRNQYYMYGDYPQQVSCYWSGSWLYSFFQIYYSGMPAQYVFEFYRFNPNTGVHERLYTPSNNFRDSGKISRNIDNNIVGALSRQGAIGNPGKQFCFMNWDVFSDGEDITPIMVTYDFLTNTRYGLGIDTDLIDGSPYVSANTSFFNEHMYCLEKVDSGDSEVGGESRFLYSGKLDSRMKGFDYVREILSTCRGFLYYCDGKIKVKIEKGTEVPVIYFGNEEVTMIASNHVVGDKDAVYIPTDTRPDNYWLGDIGYAFYIDGYGSMPYGVGGYGGTEIQKTFMGLTSPLITNFIILSSTATCLTLIENMTYEIPLDTPLILRKDNFKKDSFQYKKKGETEKINQIHLEYIHRNEEYRTDVLDDQNEYNIYWTGEIREQSFSMHGIKRNSQARRMITFLSDFNACVEWSCSLDTDIVGMLLCIGDVVGVSNDINNWYGKLFRVISMEEMEDYETKVELLEYIPTIYHDEYIANYPIYDSNYESIYNTPDHVINLDAIEDRRSQKVFIGFSKPITNNTWWIGAVIYHLNPNTELWDKIGTSYWNTFTSALSSSVTAAQTYIPFSSTVYDSDKLQSSGLIWIDDELIYYSWIDDVNYKFMDCIRGYNDTLAVVHSSGTCVYKRDALFSYDYDPINDIAKVHEFKAISITNYGISADGDTAPTTSLTIYGYYALPYPVGDLICYEIESGG